MQIMSLGYLGVNAENLADWEDFGGKFLGMQAVDKTAKTLAFRIDDKHQRFYIEQNGKTSLQFFGWEVLNAEALQAVAAKVEAAGVAVNYDDGALAQQRFVKELIWFLDPAGNRLEIFHGAAIATEAFVPGRNIAGFRTASHGLGHAVLTCKSLQDLLPFYTETLGFGISDYVLSPFKAYFLHVNPRHHSLALVETGEKGVHHVMIELTQFDDLGHGYDLAHHRGEDIGVTLGRHSNDYMTSFYTYSPSKFLVEYGWGGKEVVPHAAEPIELVDGPSLWGHNRSWLSDEANLVAKEMQRINAEKGLREPLHVMQGNFLETPMECQWWKELIAKK